MKKTVFIFGAILGMATMVSCGNSEKKELPADDYELVNGNDSSEKHVIDSVPTTQVAQPDTVAESQAENQAEIEAGENLIREVYRKVVFGNGGNAQSYFTKKVVKKLKAANEYDDGGMALWELRTGYQDGDGPSKVKSVTYIGDGWYKVSFVDMGHKGSKRIQVVDGKIADYK